jgi:FkbM family methyltransferase
MISESLFRQCSRVKQSIFCLFETVKTVYAQNHWIEIYEAPHKSPLKRDKIYEQETTIFLRKHLQKGQTVWDVGANIGYFSLEFARSVGPKGKVLSFEPHPEIFQVLQRNIRRNNYLNIITHNQACGSSLGETKLYFSTENEGNHKIIENSNSNNFAITPVVTLSTFLKEYSPSLIKMDIEGAELLALQGLGQENLKNLAIDFVIEYHPYEMTFFDIEGVQVLDFFMSSGYKFRNLAYSDYPIISKKEILKKYKKEDRSITNLFCSKSID